VGTKEHEEELETERKKNERKLTLKEARILGERLMKRREHDHYCQCDVCMPNGLSKHIKSFPVKPTQQSKPKRTSFKSRKSEKTSRSSFGTKGSKDSEGSGL
jgi:protein subunit release factor B